MNMMQKFNIHLAWIISICGTAFSLLFSEILDLPPCDLCWYQRIFMYPLVLILGVGIYKKDSNINSYALPLSILGLSISLYHILIQTFPSLSVSSCAIGVSCTTDSLNLFGFITIPMLSFLGFLIITILLYPKFKVKA
ncbi:disulfide oxidoreductase [Bacillus sp. TH13]|uniref:disulfide oxidoreductase n=1 Tax=Bacillus sp. TH13 TaxID=2796379 RepID=UPI001912489B|nr:disulfide oxidoreductase [Bacillus sp. TH13]MBK5492004.1 disulfide bond formation protein B [Bacillus sp. TH13]